MGFVKQQMIIDQERRWSAGAVDNVFVCASCVDDTALAEVVRQNVSTSTCSYCAGGPGTAVRYGAPLSAVVERIVEAICVDYDDPANQLPYCGREGGYQGIVCDTQTVLDEVGFAPSSCELTDDVCRAIVQDDWCSKDWAILDAVSRRRHGWDAFKAMTKHRRRYTFWNAGDESVEPGHPDYMPVGEMLRRLIGDALAADLIREYPVGTPLWRVRVHDPGKTLVDAADFASPPIDLAKQPNRMSPAGIPMFYGASDYATAKAETYEPDRGKEKVVSGSKFEALCPIRILDLTDLPEVPSYFDLRKRNLRSVITFMHEFTREVSAPIPRDGREHIEYVPTQAFTEYVRWEMAGAENPGIDGIAYRSPKNGGRCFVLFLDHDDCLPQQGRRSSRQLLSWVPGSVRSESMP